MLPAGQIKKRTPREDESSVQTAFSVQYNKIDHEIENLIGMEKLGKEQNGR